MTRARVICVLTMGFSRMLVERRPYSRPVGAVGGGGACLGNDR